MISRFEQAVAERSAIMARHPEPFRRSWSRRTLRVGAIAIMVALAGYAGWRLELSLGRLGSGAGELARLVTLMLPPSPGARAGIYLHALAETLAIAFLGTMSGAVLAFPLGLLAATNVVRNPVVHHAVRRFLDLIRGVDVLVWALIFINVVGLGPFAGILAITASDCGAFGKLFSEAFENADRQPMEAVRSVGGSRLQVVRFGLLPGVFPNIVSQVLYFFESNTRSATIIGIVGAGGIGLHLAEQIRILEWRKVSFLILMILVAVVVIDWISARLRFMMIGRPSLPA